MWRGENYMVQAAVTKTTVSNDSTPSNYRAMAMVTTLFFMWGFLTSLNDILVPHLKAIFELNYTKVMFINSAFFGSYFLFAVPAGKLIEKIGYKRTMVAGLLVMARSRPPWFVCNRSSQSAHEFKYDPL